MKEQRDRIAGLRLNLCICIVLCPMFLLPAWPLSFVPLAEGDLAVAAILPSSRTWCHT